jgi:hypothetical protein
LFQGGLQPHNYCLPVLKRETPSTHSCVLTLVSLILPNILPVAYCSCWEICGGNILTWILLLM